MAEPVAVPRRYTRKELEAMPKEQIIDLFLEQQGTVFSQLDRVAALEQKAGMNSQNSSRPPSSDTPGQKATKPRRRRKRKRGARLGRARHRAVGARDLEGQPIHNHRACSARGRRRAVVLRAGGRQKNRKASQG